MVPSTVRFPRILTFPVDTPTVYGLIKIVFGPLIIPVVNPIFSDEIPVENLKAVIIPVVFTLAVVDNPVAVVAVPEKVVAVIIPA